MSLFLGKIHYWLYNKISWAEKVEKDMIQWAKSKNLPIEQWTQENIERHGAPIGDKPLDEIIDTTNIHGWLQQQIESTELRQAALVTVILGQNSQNIEALNVIFIKHGEAAAKDSGDIPDSPEGMFNALHDYILEGMPCDRVNKIVSSNDNEFIWKTTTCLHMPYWEQVKGDVRNFYVLREAWTKAFIESLNSKFSYAKIDDEQHKIVRK